MAASRRCCRGASDPQLKLGGSKGCLAAMAKRGQTGLNKLPDALFVIRFGTVFMRTLNVGFSRGIPEDLYENLTHAVQVRDTRKSPGGNAVGAEYHHA